MGAEGLPVVRLETSSLPVAKRFEVWRDYASAARFEAIPTEETAADPTIDMTTWLLHNIVVGEYSYGPHQIRRRVRSRERFDREVLAVRYYREGEANGLLAETPTRVRSGTIRVTDNARDYSCVTGRMRMTTLFVPYALAGYDPSRDPAEQCFSMDTATGRILAHTIDALVGDMSSIRRSEATAISAAFGGLLRGLLPAATMTETATQAFEIARRRAILRYIDDNIRDPELDADRLCRTFHLSRATVYRIFRDHGGIRRYVMERRLDRAFLEIACKAGTRGDIGRMAAGLGFDSNAQFSRQFRRRFDAKASEIAGLGRDDPEVVQSGPGFGGHRFSLAEPINQWFSRLSP